MAKTPKKPAAAKPSKAKAANAKTTKKVKKAVGVEKLESGEQEIYRAKEEEIDLALHRCLSHFGELQPSEVRVAIKLLDRYYQTHGINGGMGMTIG